MFVRAYIIITFVFVIGTSTNDVTRQVLVSKIFTEEFVILAAKVIVCEFGIRTILSN